MPIEVLMPALSPTMEEGTLAKWHKAEGDRVDIGDVIAEIETDKATMEVEAVDDGVMGKHLVAEGTEGVKVNTVIALLLEEGEDASALGAQGNGAAAGTATGGGTGAADDAGEDDTSPARIEASIREMGGNGRDATADGESGEAGAPATSAILLKSATVEDEHDGARGDEEPAYEGETGEMTVREALRTAMAEEMRQDDNVFLMGEEVAEYQGAYKVSQGLLEEFGARRVIDTPITEHGFTGLGVGAAFAGLRPIVEFMTWNFAMQAIDQIVNSAAKTRYMSGGQVVCPIVFRGPNGAAARVAAQHSQDYAAWYSHIPGLIVLAPSSAADAKGLLKSAIRNDNPVIFLENEILYGRTGEVPLDPDWTVPIGKAKVLRQGKDVTITCHARMVEVALAAADQMAADGIEAEVIDLRTLRPMDTATVIKSVKKTNRLISVEESWPQSGVGAELAAVMMEEAFDWLDAPVARISGADVPMPYAANLEALYLPQAAPVVEAAKSILYRE